MEQGDADPTFRARRYALRDGPGAAARCRTLARTAVGDWYGPLSPARRTAAGDLLLVVTELVADAVRHGGTPYELRLDRAGDRVWVQLSDTGPVRARPHGRHRPARPGGHGLYLVERLAAAWGCVPRDRGRTVWCAAPFPPGPGGAARPGRLNGLRAGSRRENDPAARGRYQDRRRCP
ncbi:ATP-binding protein [Streptomyces termitum]|uniref:ATP-binding protein n=1 Tax=Streptomyces termitum TaxID=67368 RepID=UPI0033BCEBDE